MKESTQTYTNEKTWFAGRRAHIGQRPYTTMSPTIQIFQNATDEETLRGLVLSTVSELPGSQRRRHADKGSDRAAAGHRGKLKEP